MKNVTFLEAISVTPSNHLDAKTNEVIKGKKHFRFVTSFTFQRKLHLMFFKPIFLYIHVINEGYYKTLLSSASDHYLFFTNVIIISLHQLVNLVRYDYTSTLSNSKVSLRNKSFLTFELRFILKRKLLQSSKNEKQIT